ncbi:MAG: rhodanese-like domain-containing protein [Pseudomonadota bacterium]
MFARLACLSVLVAAISVGDAIAQSCGTTHTVRAGETLSTLAARTLGSSEKFRVIYRANVDKLGSNPNNLRVGMKIFLPCETARTPIPAPAAKAWSPLMEVPDLASRVGARVQVLDLRSEEQIAKGVIPGSISVPYENWRLIDAEPGSPEYNEALSNVIGGSGLRIGQPIIVVAETGKPMDAGRAAYVYWILKSSGARQIAMLHGGYQAWTNAEQRLAPRTRRVFSYRATVSLSEEWLVGRREVDLISKGAASGSLLDATPRSVATAGMKSADVTGLHRAMMQQGQDSVFTVLEWAKGQPVNWENDMVVSLCDTGEFAALSWFYVSEVAGIRNVKLLPTPHGKPQDDVALKL